MTINRYFENFPIINYANTQVVDITKRVAVLDSVLGNPYAFHAYEISEFERPDQFSNRYYEDPFKSWILYLTNRITDPLNEWYMQQNELEQLCENKYSSLFNAQNKIKYYQNDYVDKEPISISLFQSLPQQLKKYWIPDYGVNNRIVSYSRRQADWKTNTNRIVQYTLNESNTFVVDEVLDIYYDTNNSGKGQVLSVQGDIMYVKHVSGQFFTTETVDTEPGSYIYGHESETQSLFTNFEWVANSIPEAEVSYWRPVTYYEYEIEKNEFNKTISVMDSNYKKLITDELRNKMKE